MLVLSSPLITKIFYDLSLTDIMNLRRADKKMLEVSHKILTQILEYFGTSLEKANFNQSNQETLVRFVEKFSEIKNKKYEKSKKPIYLESITLQKFKCIIQLFHPVAKNKENSNKEFKKPNLYKNIFEMHKIGYYFTSDCLMNRVKENVRFIVLKELAGRDEFKDDYYLYYLIQNASILDLEDNEFLIKYEPKNVCEKKSQLKILSSNKKIKIEKFNSNLEYKNLDLSFSTFSQIISICTYKTNFAFKYSLDFSKIESLNLFNCSLDCVPNLDYLPSLKTLCLRKNEIKKFMHITNESIEFIDLCENKLEIISNCYLPNLQYFCFVDSKNTKFHPEDLGSLLFNDNTPKKCTLCNKFILNKQTESILDYF